MFPQLLLTAMLEIAAAQSVKVNNLAYPHQLRLRKPNLFIVADRQKRSIAIVEDLQLMHRRIYPKWVPPFRRANCCRLRIGTGYAPEPSLGQLIRPTTEPMSFLKKTLTYAKH